MNQTQKTIGLVALLFLVLVGGYAYFSLSESIQQIQVVPPVQVGGVGADPSYGGGGLTNTSSTCGILVSATVVATSSGRTSFIASWTGGSVVSLCKGPTCTIGTGITLATSTPRYEQMDSYIGPYSCISINATTSIQTVYSP